MYYKPLETAVNYFKDLDKDRKYIAEKVVNSLKPIGLELVLVSVPSNIGSSHSSTYIGDYSNGYPPNILYFSHKNHRKNPPPPKWKIEQRRKNAKKARDKKKGKTR